jgi:2-polyprenyl-3-methyl-5-hydroxy-6-metoxy-1,4-benzoquinol methylase
MSLRGALEERLALMAPARRLRLALGEEVLRARLGDRPAKLLDAGAGDGLLSLSLAKRHPRWTFLGVDLRADLLEGARARAAARDLPNVEFASADLTRPLPATGFDAVLALECLSEIPEDELALRMMADALLPGGVLVVQVPERSWRPVLRGSARTWREQIRQGYDAEQLAAALRQAGLDSVEIRGTYRRTATIAQELRDRIKDAGVAVRAAAFPALAAAVRLERWGVTGGRPNALLAVAQKPQKQASAHPA